MQRSRPGALTFSRRIPARLEENALSRALEARRAAGLPVLDLTESNPTRAGFSYPEAELLAALAAPAGLTYQPEPLGLLSAREAVARYLLESRGARVAPDRIVLAASTSEAYGWLFKLLCDPGDAVLVPAPCYPLFDWLTALEAVRTIDYPLRWDGEWHLDLAALERALGAEERVRALLLVSPGNPTGAYLKLDEYARVSELCAARGVALISDEVFADYATAEALPARAQATCALDGQALSFTLSGLSKVCGLPQLKLGWCAVTGPREQVASALARLELIADTYLSVAAPVQHALPGLLAQRVPLQAQLRARCAANRARLEKARASALGAAWDLLPAEAGWSAILRIPDARAEEPLALALLERGVLAQPGFFYDFPRGNFLVLSLLVPEERLAKALPALLEVLA